ncbi:lipopolysaccharide-induced tumor necrosis factor-alpha factor homolog [Narcine bancroftii]|uniref:lipopolysaccharide-induced tumor necrosis factor-alpha factor homolog n=1 Tax=Narcine bancroftii TaxID=1343680 RepID=UPI00383169CC
MNSKASAPPSYADSMQAPGYQANAAYPGPPVVGDSTAPSYPAQPPVVVQTVYVQPSQSFGAQPVQTTCPSCRQVVITRIRYAPGLLTWISCGGLFFVGCVLGCCLIPFCVDSLQDVDHNCPNCGVFLGSFKRL